MCHIACNEYVTSRIKEEYIRGKSVLDIGSCDINGSMRSYISQYNPSKYMGIDVNACDHENHPYGIPCVDKVCDAVNVLETFGPESFDFILSTEVFEHVEDWKASLINLKGALKRGGFAILTTRSIGFPVHCEPDNWRYSLKNIRNMFSDFLIIHIAHDPQFPGVFIVVQKPEDYKENDVSNIKVFNMKRWHLSPFVRLRFSIAELWYMASRWSFWRIKKLVQDSMKK